MINCTTNRGKTIVSVTPPELTDQIMYRVYVNNEPYMFEGNCRYFGGDFEVDVKDWIESWEQKKIGMGAVDLRCSVLVQFFFYAEGNLLSTLGKSFRWVPENIDMEGPDQVGLICGGSSSYPWVIDDAYHNNYPYTISVWPIFFFTMYYKIGDVEYIAENCMFDAYNTYNMLVPQGRSVFTYDTFPRGGQTVWTEQEAFNDNVAKKCDYEGQIDADCDIYVSPKLLFPDGSRVNNIPLAEVLNESGDLPEIEPIFKIADMQDIRDEDIYLYNALYRYTEDELMTYYNNNVKVYIDALEGNEYILPIDLQHPHHRTMTDISLTMTGYGYKTMILYNDCGGLIPNPEWNQNIYTQEYINCSGKNHSCPKANLVLYNSGFVFSSNESYKNDMEWDEDEAVAPIREGDTPMDVVIPLMVSNGVIKGKTINNVDKTTYMDRYGDTHNSVTDNKYELEFYIDPEWLSVTSTRDINYMKLMLACQGSLKSYLCGNAGISGMVTDGTYVIEGRVKDVEKIETLSSYSNTKKVPTYKVVFEVYK